MTSNEEKDWRGLLRKFEVTEQQIKRIEDSEPIWHDLIFSGMAHVWVARPNGGKTALAIQAAADMAFAGLDVFYFQLDAGGAQLKGLHKHSLDNGYTLLSTLGQGTSDMDVKKALIKAADWENHSNTVFILDTLKKFVDVNSKQQAPEFYSVLRGFTQRGGTVLTLAHATKYKEGNAVVPDGVMDLINDADNVAMLDGIHKESCLTVSTNHSPDSFGKSRAKIEEATFSIDKATYTVSRVDFEDQRAKVDNEQQEKDDEPTIKAIKDFLKAGATANKSTIIDVLKLCQIGSRQANRVLANTYYHDRHWKVEKGDNNATLFSRVPVETV